MGVHLLNSCGSEFNSNTEHYTRALNLACDYGWEPAGIKPPRGREEDFYDDDYLISGGQTITTADAAEIAKALKIALDDIPNEDQQGGKTDDELSPLEYFSGPFKEWLKQFAGFCTAGSFRVY